MPLSPDLIATFSSLGLSTEPDSSLPPLLPPPTPTPALQKALSRLDLLQAKDRLDEDGYTVIDNVFSPEECDQLIAAVQSKTRIGYIKNLLQSNDALFFEAVVREKLMVLAEAVLGPDFLMLQSSATVFGPHGGGVLPAGLTCYGLHSDQPMHDPRRTDLKLYSAPRNRTNMLTCCVVLSDGYSAETGATHVVPGSHHLRRFPDPAAVAHAEEIAEPIVAKRGDVACWDSNVWHAFGVRQIPGERVVLHISYAHPEGGEAHDDYDAIPSNAFMGQPFEQPIIQLLQRHPTTGEIQTTNPHRRRLYWEEASLRFMDRLPASFGKWLYKKSFAYLAKKEFARAEKAAT